MTADAAPQTSPTAIATLSVEDRLQLLKFVCAFAWADFTVKPAERELVGRIVQRCGLDADESAQVEAWLQSPPNPDEIDPLDVPQEHRQLLLGLVLEMIAVDGEISPEESETYNLLTQLLS